MPGIGVLGGVLTGIGGILDTAQASQNARRAARAATFTPSAINTPAGSGSFVPRAGGGFTGTFNPSIEVEGLLAGVQGLGQSNLQSQGAVGEQFQNLGVRPDVGVQDSFLGLQNFLAGAQGPQFSTQGAIGQQLAGDVGSNLFNQQLLGGQISPSVANFNNAAGGAFGNAATQQQFGAGFLGQQVGSFQDAATQQLASLRAAALPQQQRAATSLADRLFSGGQLGTSGGANIFGRLDEAQNQQDLGFQVASQQLAQTLQGQDIQRVLGQQQIGGNLLSGATQSFGQGGNLLSGGVNSLLGLTQGQLPFQQNTANVGSMFTNESGQDFGIQNSRVTQRLANAQNLFGFGQATSASGLNAGVQALSTTAGVNDIGLNTLALGANVGSAQASAGANVGNFLLQRPSVAGQSFSTIGGLLGG